MDFVLQPMLTCIGNKRKLLAPIREIITGLAARLGKEKVSVADGFAGSTVVSRELATLATDLYVNDLENYSYQMAQCYLVAPEDRAAIDTHIREMNRIAEEGPFQEGIISRLYAPRETANIQEGERCFYTRENALILDTLRQYIAQTPAALHPYLLAPLLVRASIHTNTAGVFKGFYKNGRVGCFGGTGRNALSRIMKPIRVDMPIWSEAPYTAHITRLDIAEFIRGLPRIDVIYLDPPYNQHPYGSNYFMLNVLIDNVEPQDISVVSGIPKRWNKSAYNSRVSAVEAMQLLLRISLEKASYVVLSYNNEGIITEEDWQTLLAPYTVETHDIRYDAYKGVRNLRNRGNKVMERMRVISENNRTPTLAAPIDG